MRRRADGARALGAGLSGADLSRVRWGGGVSSFANADCTAASFAGAQLIDIDASQALLDGASFADAVLIGVRLGGARIRFVPGTRRPSFTNALVLGARFDAALVGDAVFAGAWVALEDGVPLARLETPAWDDLAAGRYEPVRAAIAAAGYALSGSTRFTAVDRWFVANAGNGGEKGVTTFALERARTSRKEYAVYDRTTGAYLFRLNGMLTPPSSGPAPADVANAFRANGHPLGDTSTIARTICSGPTIPRRPRSRSASARSRWCARRTASTWRAR